MKDFKLKKGILYFVLGGLFLLVSFGAIVLLIIDGERGLWFYSFIGITVMNLFFYLLGYFKNFTIRIDE